MRGRQYAQMTAFDISLIFTLFWGIWEQNLGSKGVKKIPYPYKSHYKCYIWVKGHMRDRKDTQIKTFDI